MKKMTMEETKNTIGGSLSGSFLTGIGDVIDAVTNFIGGIGGLSFIFSGMESQHSQGNFKFNKNLSFDWNDTKGKAENVAEVDLSHHQSEIKDYNQFGHAYDLT